MMNDKIEQADAAGEIASKAAYSAWCNVVTTDNVPERLVWAAAFHAGREYQRSQPSCPHGPKCVTIQRCTAKRELIANA